MIRVGVGGWTYPPWRGSFYPPGLPHARELEYASRQLTAIEINATFYGTQKPASFRRWADATPDGFIFAVKGPGAVVNRRSLVETGPGIQRFIDSGIAELAEKLGPILWQFAPSRVFDEADVAAFLAMLPCAVGGRELRHALEVRHASFVDPRFIALARQFHVAIVYADSPKYPEIGDQTGAFTYARLQRSAEAEQTGYAGAALAQWAERCLILAGGRIPEGLPVVTAGALAELPALPQDVFVFFISGFKERAPAAATALIRLL